MQNRIHSEIARMFSVKNKVNSLLDCIKENLQPLEKLLIITSNSIYKQVKMQLIFM